MWPDGTIFRLQRRRRNVSEERSFLWNFQPIRDEYSQPSPGSRLCREHCINQSEILTAIKNVWEIFLFLTSTAAVWSDIFFLGLTSLILRWTWYIFSAATQDLGLSSGGMVIPYSQPIVQRKWKNGSDLQVKKLKKKNFTLFTLNFTSFIYSPVTVKAPVILPGPSWWTVKLSWTSGLFSILHNTVHD